MITQVFIVWSVNSNTSHTIYCIYFDLSYIYIFMTWSTVSQGKQKGFTACRCISLLLSCMHLIHCSHFGLCLKERKKSFLQDVQDCSQEERDSEENKQLVCQFSSIVFNDQLSAQLYSSCHGFKLFISFLHCPGRRRYRSGANDTTLVSQHADMDNMEKLRDAHLMCSWSPRSAEPAVPSSGWCSSDSLLYHWRSERGFLWSSVWSNEQRINSGDQK